jgi:hypothetical protein
MMPTLYGALCCWAVAAGPPAAYQIESQPSQRIEAELSFSQQYPGFKAREWAIVVARPPELPGQTKLTTVMEPAAQVKVVQDAGDAGRSLFLLCLPVRDAKLDEGFKINVKYTATLLSRKLVPGKAKSVAPLSAAEEKASLGSTPSGDFKAPEFQKWLDANKLRRASADDDVDFARRIFLAITNGYKYDFQPNQDRRVSKLCTAPGTDCGGMALLFAAACRANNIPARVLAGRWAQSADPTVKVGGAPYYQVHVKAEFFAKGVGWVPVDPSSAKQYDKKEGLRYFGNDAGDFLTMHVDTDLVVDTGQLSSDKKSVPWLQGVKFWVKPPPSSKGEAKESWQVKKLGG